MFDKLCLVKESNGPWKVRVRVIRLWFSTAYNGVFQGCNLIMLDQENYAVHAIIKPDKWVSIANVVIEGNIYDVTNFSPKTATGTLRPVHSNICIHFTNDTIIQSVLQDDLTIPMHSFNFTDLSHLSDIVNSYPETKCPDYSIDIIGFMEDLQEPSLVQTIYGERQLVRFTLTDGRFKYKVNIWMDDVANVDMLFEDDLQSPIVVIVASARLCKFVGIVEIATLPSTKLYVNLQNDNVSKFRQSHAIDGFPA